MRHMRRRKLSKKKKHPGQTLASIGVQDRLSALMLLAPVAAAGLSTAVFSLRPALQRARRAPPAAMLIEDQFYPDDDAGAEGLPDSLFGDDDSLDLGLVSMPLLQTPAQASFQRFRERMQQRRGGPQLGVNGEDNPIGRCILGDADPAAGTEGGNDLGFSLKETIFDSGDDVFGI